MIDITTIANNVTFMYALFLIIMLLMYIAFYKKSSSNRSQRK